MSTGVMYIYTFKKYVKKSIVSSFTIAIAIANNLFGVLCITSNNKFIFLVEKRHIILDNRLAQ